MSDREKPSWRELDRRRDQSAHRREAPKPKGPPARTATASATYRKQLDALFDKGVVADSLKDKLPFPEAEAEPTGPAAERLKLMRAVRTVESGPALVAAIDALREKFGLPDDLELLVRVLEHPKDPVLLEALNLIEPHVELGDKLPNKKVLVQRLKGIEVSSFDPRVQRKAGLLAGKLR